MSLRRAIVVKQMGAVMAKNRRQLWLTSKVLLAFFCLGIATDLPIICKTISFNQLTHSPLQKGQPPKACFKESSSV